MYGSYVIGINGAIELMKRGATTLPVGAYTRSGAFDYGWRPVRYAWSEKRTHIDNLFTSLAALAGIAESAQPAHEPDVYEAAIECIVRSAIYLKDESFAHESEVRLYGRALATNAEVNFRVGEYGIVPYLTVELAKDRHPAVGRFPVQHINMGPGLREREAAFAGLSVALDRLGYGHVTVDDRSGSRRT